MTTTKVNISVDPGLRGTGVAVWSIKNWPKLVRPLYHFIVSSRLPYAQAGIDVADAVCRKLSAYGYEVENMYCEFPSVWANAVSYSAATSGDILRLTYGIGCIAGRMPNCSLHMVGVNEWKGQLSKEQVETRIVARLSDIRLSMHEWDAVGIGLYAKGHF